jgi:hypothetical protein
MHSFVNKLAVISTYELGRTDLASAWTELPAVVQLCLVMSTFCYWCRVSERGG